MGLLICVCEAAEGLGLLQGGLALQLAKPPRLGVGADWGFW